MPEFFSLFVEQKNWLRLEVVALNKKVWVTGVVS